MLKLVLQHEPEDEPLPEQRPGPVELGVLDRLEDAFADRGRIRPDYRGAEYRRLRPVSFPAERFVHLGMRVDDGRLSVEVAEKPQLLEASDARKLPDQR